MADGARVKAFNELASVALVRKAGQEVYFLHQDYRLIFPDKSYLSDTAQLVVFELISSGGGPEFHGRWEILKRTLDIDVLGVSKAQKKRFKQSERGSSGHHAIRVDEHRSKFRVPIVYEGMKIFDGLIWVHLDFRAPACCTIVFSGSVELNVR